MTRNCTRPGCGHPDDLHSSLVGCTANDSVSYCTCPAFQADTAAQAPITPYDGGTSSGHSGTDTSAARAERNDTDGTTRHVQEAVLNMAKVSGPVGLTIRDVRAAMPEHHHGTLSGALSVLHKAGSLYRLTERRDRCAVYVHPLFVSGRPTEAQASRGKAKPTREQVREAVASTYANPKAGATLTDAITDAVMALL